MKQFIKIAALVAGVAFVLGFTSCTSEGEKLIPLEKIVEVTKNYAQPVTVTAKATQNKDEVSVSMVSQTEGAEIYYTTDGTTPTAQSTKYTAAVVVTADTTFKAIAVKAGIENSPVSYAKISIKEKKVVETKTVEVEKTYAQAVTFGVEATQTEGEVSVTMTCQTEDAEIYYTTDGTTPTAQSTKYTAAVVVTADTTFKAIAVKAGIENSPVSYAKISIKEKKVVETNIETKTVVVDKKADEIAPANVTDLVALSKDSRVLLVWTDATDEDVYGYEVTYAIKDVSRVVLPALEKNAIVVAKGASGCYVSGLINGIEYTFTVKTIDTSGNKSTGVTATAKPKVEETMKIVLTAAVPHENDYTGTKSNTKVTVTANITTASNVSRVVWKKDGSFIAKTLLADIDAIAALEDPTDNKKWTFDITATDETANGRYTVAAIDEAGREEAEWINIDHFDFTAPAKIKQTSSKYENSSITLNWTEPAEEDFDHVEISYISDDGTIDSEGSPAIIAKETTSKTFSGIDGDKNYYKYTLISVDRLGNKSSAFTYVVCTNASEDFHYVTGSTVSSAVANSDVFIEGRTVTIGNLLVCNHEVTQKEYETYCKYGDVSPSNTPEYGVGDNFPAYYVSWYDATVYCNLRSMAENLTPVYAISGETNPTKWNGIVGNAADKWCGPSSNNSTWDYMTFDTTANGYRLPTEAEWEYVARGGNNGIPTPQTTYSGSDSIDDVAWCYRNSGKKSHEVKGKEANTLGIFDMSGNVWEWCYDDWHDDEIGRTRIYLIDSDNNVKNNDYIRVVRGGGWINFKENCAVFFKQFSPPHVRRNFYGFRVVRNAD